MKKKVKKKEKKKVNPLVILAVAVILIIIVIAMIFVFLKLSENNKIIDDFENQIIETREGCISINLKILELDSNFNIIKIKRGIGEGDLYKIRVYINEESEDIMAIGLDESEEKQFLLDIEPGDEVKIAAVLRDGGVCGVSDELVA